MVIFRVGCVASVAGLPGALHDNHRQQGQLSHSMSSPVPSRTTPSCAIAVGGVAHPESHDSALHTEDALIGNCHPARIAPEILQTQLNLYYQIHR